MLGWYRLDILGTLFETVYALDTGRARYRGINNKMENKKMTKGPSLQDPFLNTLRKEKIPVSIYLVNGIKLQGLVESFDQFVVLLKNTVSQMVYKHAISTVVPSRNVASPLDYSNNNGSGHAPTPAADPSAKE